MLFKPIGDTPKRIKYTLAVFTALCIAMGAAGCTGSTVSDGESTLPVISEPISESAETSHSYSEEPAYSEETSSASLPTAEESAETAHAPETNTSEETEHSEETELPDETEPPEETEPAVEPQPPATTHTEQSTAVTTQPTVVTTTSSSTTQTTATEAAPPPVVTVVIPDVKTVSSPGKSVISAANGCVDYSNASLGYISACYTGSSKTAKLRIVCNGVTYDHDVSPGGGYEYFPLSCGSGSYTIQLYEQADGNYYTVVLEDSINVSISDAVSMYLYPNKYVLFNKNSAAVKKAAELCAGADGTIEKLAAIFGWITENISYDYDLAATVQGGYVPNPDSVLSKKKGICFDYSSLLAAMARSQGIPTRLVIGYASPDIYHAWNEVYTKETGWITPELLLSKSGYNLVDATFYSGSPDKSKISAYIMNGGNYSAIYYY